MQRCAAPGYPRTRGSIRGLKFERILQRARRRGGGLRHDNKKIKESRSSTWAAGTFDVSILALGTLVRGCWRPTATAPWARTTGSAASIDFIARIFRKKEVIDIRKDPMALQRLKRRPKGQVELSTMNETTVISFITGGPKLTQAHAGDPDLSNSRRCEHLCESLEGPVPAGAKARRSSVQIDEVVLVGGSPRMPKRSNSQGTLGKESDKSVNPDEVGGLAIPAIQGGRAAGDVHNILLLDVNAALAGRGDAGRSDDEAHRAEHDDSQQQEGVFSTARRHQTACDPCPSLRAGSFAPGQP